MKYPVEICRQMFYDGGYRQCGEIKYCQRQQENRKEEIAMKYHVGVISGDGIGPEIVREAK